MCINNISRLIPNWKCMAPGMKWNSKGTLLKGWATHHMHNNATYDQCPLEKSKTLCVRVIRKVETVLICYSLKCSHLCSSHSSPSHPPHTSLMQSVSCYRRLMRSYVTKKRVTTILNLTKCEVLFFILFLKANSLWPNGIYRLITVSSKSIVIMLES